MLGVNPNERLHFVSKAGVIEWLRMVVDGADEMEALELTRQLEAGLPNFAAGVATPAAAPPAAPPAAPRPPTVTSPVTGAAAPRAPAPMFGADRADFTLEEE